MKNILIVEDERSRRLAIEDALHDEAFFLRWTDCYDLACHYIVNKCWAECDPEKGYEDHSLGKAGYHLVILDVDELLDEPWGTQKRYEGMRVLQRIRREIGITKDRLPVIGTTHHMPPDWYTYEKRFLEEGGNYFFEYDFDMDDLVRKVYELLKLSLQN